MSTGNGYNVEDLFRRYFNIAPRLPIFLPAPPAGSKAADLARDWVYGLRNAEGRIPEYVANALYDVPEGYFLDAEKSETGTALWDVYKFVKPDTTLDVGPEYRMPVLTVADFNQVKNIVKTPVNGRKGTVKELISDGDWQVRFRGFIVDYVNDAYPLDAVIEMRNTFSVGKSMKIVSKLCNGLGIYDLVCESLTINPLDGAATTAQFELLCTSDESIELEVQNV